MRHAPRSHRRAGSTTAAFLALSLTAAACSTGSSKDDNSGGGNTTAGISKEKLAVAQGEADKYKGLPTFTAPGPEVDISKVRGKHMFLIPLVPNPFNESIQNTMKEVAERAGMRFTLYPNQGQVSQWVQGMNQAVTAKPDIIVLNTAPDPRVLQPQLAAAKAAGIPVLVTHFHDDSSAEPPSCEGCAAGVTALVTAPFYVAGAAAANWIIADSKGKNHTLIVGANDALPSPGTVDTVRKVFAENCGDTCKTSFVNVPIPDWNTKVQSEVQSALNKDPSINYVYVLYDAMVSGAVPAVQTTGKSGKVKVISYNGSPFALKFIQDGNIMAMDVGEDTVGIGYTNMDQAFRILTGMPIVKSRTPIRIFDKSNVEDAGSPPAAGKGYGNALAEGFSKLWGLQ